MNKTLLQKAKEIPYGRPTISGLTNDLLELCIGWVNREVTTSQVEKVLGVKTPVSSVVASTLRKAVAADRIKISTK